MKNSFISRPAFYALHVLFWLCYGAILYAALSGWIYSSEQLWGAVVSDVLTSSSIAYLNYYLLLPRLYRKGKYTAYILASIGIVVVIVLLRVSLLGMTHRSVAYTYFIRSVPAIGFYLITTVIWFFANMISAQRKEIELRNSQLASELKFLKLQLSPHFLFNTLNNIYSMAYFQDHNTAPAIMKLSEMMRHMLYEDQGKFVSLKKEILFMENFIELWRLKLDEKPVIVFKHEGVKDRHRIAHLIFLVFLENAFKHGNTVDGKIDIRLTIDSEDKLHFFISNDVIKARKTAEEESGVGLSNVKKRLNLIYPRKHTLMLDQDASSFIVKLTIDLK
ncbi:sensor histidine kinase [Echinicola strongylocentroti]|uniref:Sensor histidine kinase n=1 Tax=Echinicola strongylocentroti TaxID=1795355 RepID=A0A2Z4IGW4_9BACT|nr:sensor histidine kinase [Echinicola strongylocentroti]AWW29673.1 sensor histidine kinase [Echinicola strongylocentroti]